MEFMWLYSLCQCILSVALIVVSIRLCMGVGSNSTTTTVVNNQEGPQDSRRQPGSVSRCLRLCLGWVGAVGGAVEVPATVLLNLRSPQCLYTCITMVCIPLLVRQFTMFLLILIILDTHLQHHLMERYSSLVTRRRALLGVLLCWVGSVLASFAQFIGSDVLHTRENDGPGPDTTDLGLEGNWTTSFPPLHTSSPTPPWYHRDRKVIAKFLPYGGFLSKFYVEDRRNFTYAQYHSSHWAVCAPDTILSPQFLVYVHGMTVFLLPLICLLAVYLDLLCIKSRVSCCRQIEPLKYESCQVRSLVLSLSLLVVLCLPLHVIHTLSFFTPDVHLPAWAHAGAMLLFQLYSLVPQILFTPPGKKVEEDRAMFPHSVPNLPPAVPRKFRGKSVRLALCEGPWVSAKHSLKAKVCPEV